MSNKVLVTGGTGFIGAYIIRELIEKGYSVRAIRRSNKLPFFIAGNIMEKVEWIDGDVLDVLSLDDAMKDIDTVIHSAAVISFFKSERKTMYKVNIEGTANVVNMAIENKVRQFVHISSISAVGRTESGARVDEEKKWSDSKANTHYGITKYNAELEAWRGAGEGLSTVIVNPSTVLGFGDWNNGSGAIFKSSYKEFPWYTSGVNGFVDVEDVARAVVLLMESGITEERFIINAENWDFKKVFYSISDGFHKKRPNREATPFLGEIAWRVEKIKSMLTGSRPLLTKESARVALSKTYWVNDKILKALPGFSFVPLEETILKACKKYDEAVKNKQLSI